MTKFTLFSLIVCIGSVVFPISANAAALRTVECFGHYIVVKFSTAPANTSSVSVLMRSQYGSPTGRTLNGVKSWSDANASLKITYSQDDTEELIQWMKYTPWVEVNHDGTTHEGFCIL